MFTLMRQKASEIRLRSFFLLVCILALVGPVSVFAEEAAPTVAGNAEAIAKVQSHLDFVWTLIAAFLVFFMQAGFAMVETGFTRAKNAVNTNMAAAAGAVSAMITAWVMYGKPEASMTLNGALAGLVAITAGCANVSVTSSVIIGLIAGILVVLSVVFIDKKLKVDDPVGAVSVHGVCGAFGTLAAGLFNAEGFSAKVVGVQLLGIGAAFLWVFPLMYILFKVIEKTIGLRVSAEEEKDGLDVGEHGLEAYPDFTLTGMK